MIRTRTALLCFLPLLLAGCGSSGPPPVPAIATPVTLDTLPPGIHRQSIDVPKAGSCNYTLLVPPGYDGKTQVPLIVALHYGGSVSPHYGKGMIALFSLLGMNVKAIFPIRGLDASGFPASTPKPCTTFTTPGGRRSAMSSMNTMIETGVCSAGLITTQLPAARAGASFHTAINRGKFHGMICPTTPSGRGSRPGNAYRNLSAQPA